MDHQSEFTALLADIARLKTEQPSGSPREIAQAKIIDKLTAMLHGRQQLIDELTASNRELARLSNTDGLTSLYNHRFMMDRCAFEFNRVRRYHGGLSCVLIDIDNFKLFNDTYGHQFGDFVLKELGALLKETARSSDICGRYGGEEFMILIPRPIEAAMEYVRRLHNTIADHVFSDGGRSARITVSIGLADYRCEMRDWSEMISRADQVLYLAKNSGRNMIRAWSGESGEPAEIIDNRGINSRRKQFTAEAFDAMTTSWPFRPEIIPAEALQQIAAAKGHHFARQLADAFLRCMAATQHDAAQESAPAGISTAAP